MTIDSGKTQPFVVSPDTQTDIPPANDKVEMHKNAHGILQSDMFNFDVLHAPVKTFEKETDAGLVHWIATGGRKTAGLAWKELGRRRGWLFRL
jgi:hypothetical protein